MGDVSQPDSIRVGNDREIASVQSRGVADGDGNELSGRCHSSEEGLMALATGKRARSDPRMISLLGVGASEATEGLERDSGVRFCRRQFHQNRSKGGHPTAAWTGG